MKQKIVFYSVVVVYIITVIMAMIINLNNNDQEALMMTLVAIITPWLIPTVFKLLKWQMSIEVKIVNITFIYLASLIGSGLNGYHYPYFDKIVHFFSGILASLLMISLFCLLKNKRKISDPGDYQILLLFTFSSNLAIALLWEFFEYLMLILFNNDCINHYTTGVHDSLTDMLCALVGGLIVIYCLINYYQRGKRSFVIDFYEHLYALNKK